MREMQEADDVLRSHLDWSLLLLLQLCIPQGVQEMNDAERLEKAIELVVMLYRGK